MSTPTTTAPLVAELQHIEALIADNELQQAATALNAVQHRVHPRDPRLFLLGMRLSRQAGNMAGAIELGRRVLALTPNWSIGLIEIAMLLSAAGQHQEALGLAQKATALEPRNVDILHRAMRVTEAAGQQEQATTLARQMVQLNPDDRVARLTLADRLMANPAGKDEAAAIIEQLLQETPQDIGVLFTRAKMAHRQGREEVARADAETLLRLAPDDERIRYFHAVLHGQTPATQPESDITALFDAYAVRFDKSLWGTLQYRVPQQVAELLVNLHPDRNFNLLDLGCGTGLVGLCVSPIKGSIIGVDLSSKMIEQAAMHKVYARFHHINILDALTHTPSDHYDAITCCDALVYVGDLTPVIPSAWRILKPGGHFIFSCETATEDEADLVLRLSYRYAHKASHVQQLCQQAGFDDVKIEHLPMLRMEGGKPLPGFLVVAHKPAAAA
ncbi:MAG: methyltransferase domain-containing protein [Burkholderiaceae bacterium]|jgi:predicted TPR repeat methyltransferase|nr:methyltransferase domain-containing protein [Burkholderiaceae bacterium]